ncbi:2-hydroxyacid dehydrogenase [Pseudalkalibacillus sp. R45]|uniref:2-hydroxyacid dehydrogenase n=1 Tax=Pseudalkalibacillus sp. R45 TaxID=3457433 RepID=UPI003FCD7E3D
MKPTIYITRKIDDQIVEKIRETCEVEMWPEEDTPVPRSVLEEKIQKIDGLFCLLTETIDKTLLEKAENLKVVSNLAVGYNNIDIQSAKEKGITVTNTPGVLTETTADLTFALMMATARRIVESSSYLRDGEWKTWSPMQLTGQDIYGATLGIIGMGRIGEAVVKRAFGFGMNVVYHNRSRKQEAEKKYGITYVSMDQLLKKSDFICVLTPYTKETHDLIDEKELSLMKSTAILINTARGGIVNEEALYNALKDNKIWAAGLDVFEQEPIPLDHPLLTLPNVVTLPHIGSASIKTRLKMANVAADNLIKSLKNEKPEYVVV